MTSNTPNTMTLKEIRAHLAQQREQALAEHMTWPRFIITSKENNNETTEAQGWRKPTRIPEALHRRDQTTRSTAASKRCTRQAQSTQAQAKGQEEA